MKHLKHSLLLISSLITIGSYAQQATDTTEGATCTSGCCCSTNDKTPAGIMTANIHEKNKWMISYTYMNMAMQGNRIGTQNAGNDVIYKNYLMSPEKMDMQMHMAMVMYGVTNRLTLMGMAGFAYNTMTMTTNQVLSCCPPGSNVMQSWSSGFTDTKIYGLYSISQKNDHQLIGSLGLSLPTGSINARGITVLGNNERLSYDMQLGSGSFSAMPAITYINNGSLLSWGASAGADVKMDKNNNGYKYGNSYNATAWLSHGFFSFLSASLRAEGVVAEKITGEDPAIAIPYNLKGDPTTNASNSGGQWVSVYLGANLHFDKPILSKFHVLLEYGIPVFQDLNGTQMSLHSNLLASLQYSF